MCPLARIGVCLCVSITDRTTFWRSFSAEKWKNFFSLLFTAVRGWIGKNGAAPVPIANWVCFDLWSIQLCWNHHDSTASTPHHIVIGRSVYIYTTSFDVTFHIQMQLRCALVYRSSDWNGEKLANFNSSELYSSFISFFHSQRQRT